MPAQTHEGAVGGQLLGAVGSAIGISLTLGQGLGLVLDFIIPGIGSLVGTIIGTLIGDAVGSHPHPAAVDTIDQAGDHYGYNHSQVSASDGGDYSIPDPMARSVDAIVNAYFSAVHGVVLDHFKQTMVGYVTDPDFRYIAGWAPTHRYYSFIHPDDAVHAAALDILQHSEVIGGDLLLKRAHQNSTANVAGPEPDWAGLTTPSEQSGAEQLITLSADLSVAQDYENYLNNREAINALTAANPDSAFTAGWIATFARVNDLKLNHMNASDFLGGLVGYLDSVGKAGLGAAANATVRRGADNSVIVEVKVAGGVEVPGSLSVFADRVTIVSDAGGQTVQFTVDSGVVASGYHFLGAGVTSGDGGNDFWIGAAGVANNFAGSGGHDILVGGAAGDTIGGGGGWDFIDGGAGNDTLAGGDGNDILRGGSGNDGLYGVGGNDTYNFARGDGFDVVLDDYRYMEADGAGYSGAPGAGNPGFHEVHASGGLDSLQFGAGISLSDLVVASDGADLIVGVKDPAHPNTPFGQLTDILTLQRWMDADGKDRIETFRFADGAVLNVAAGMAAFAPYQVPFGATLSGHGVAENAPNGTVVGTVTGFDIATTSLSYSLIDDPYGRFAINAATGVMTVANGALLDYEAARSHTVTVRVADQVGHVFSKPFTINVSNLNERPYDAALSGGGVAENAADGTYVATVTGFDPDAGASLRYSLSWSAGGRFAINPVSGAITVANGALLDYEAARSHTVTVRTTDQAGLYLDTNWSIAVTNVNEAPIDVTLSGSSVAENSPNATYVGKVTGLDPDAGAVLTYSLLDDAGGRFWIYPATGEILVVNPLLIDYETARSYHVTVRIADQYGLSVDKGWTINLTNVNEAPIDATLSGGVVAENSRNGTVVATVTGLDPDAGASLHYALTRDAGGLFAIDASSGVVTVANFALLNYEEAHSHIITVRITDQAGLYLDTNWSLALANVDEAPIVTVSDFNGDGRNDILWRSDSGAIATWNMYDHGYSGLVIGSAPSDWHIAGTGDFNGDGKADILWRSDGGSIGTWNMNDRSHGVAVIGSAPNGWRIAGTGDFNGDHKTDILWRDDSGSVGTWNMTDGAYSSAVIGSAPNSWRIAGTGDFNGDGKTDILWRDDGGSVGTWDMNDHAYSSAVIGAAPSDWHIVGTGDFNGDGRSDILWRSDGGSIGTWDMNDHAYSSAVIGSAPNDWHIAGIGDFNGDHKTDILWRDDNGTVATWDMNDHSHSAVVIATVPNDWHII
ncbi:cadherin domain-containing protein [Bradyrhizobium sp.]|uniref:cadherin domain-containing protein n=1 Tax=Bradyrhizobium sp. TaxID=376 RepID=UPI002E0C8598|nr:cadherin domain-containing protein [Bradyrhizobium sp.]